MGFLDKLRAAVTSRDSLLCVGLDPDVDRLPEGLPRGPDGVLRFNREIIAVTQDLACAYKPNLAFYEALGREGYDVLRESIRAIPGDLISLGDAKRADISTTSRMYARALFDQLGFDAVTVNPYLGGDAIQPFLDYTDRGVFVVCRTSNPGAADLESRLVSTDAGRRPLFEVVACLADGWNAAGNVGLVLGATAPEELARAREIAPTLPFLVPGIGAQAGDLAAAVRASRPHAPALISASRSILYASTGRDFAEMARRAAIDLKAAINRLRHG